MRYRLWVANGVLALTLLGTLWGRSLEGATIANPAFLADLRLPFRDWKATEGSITPEEEAILQPDAVLVRTYRAADRSSVELTVVAGHRKRTVHTPGYCMVGGGWEVVSQRKLEVDTPAGRIPVVRAVMSNEGRGLVATYFFTDGVYSTREVLQLQGVNLVKRLKGEVPLSALVRIVVPVTTDSAAAAALTDAFAEATVPAILKALRETPLRPA